MTAHLHTPRAPWYVLERDDLGWQEPAAARPTLQKYDRSDFVTQILEDPRRSLEFEPEDVWTFPVRVKPSGTGRARLATHRMVPTAVRKLFQPNHDRFYAVVAELVCQQPGLPMPGGAPGVEVSYVLRRERLALREPASAKQREDDEDVLRRIGHELATALASGQDLDDEKPVPADRSDVVDSVQLKGSPLTEDQRERLHEIGLHRVVEGWVGDSTGGTWTTLPESADEPVLLAGEQVRPMWAVPVPDDACPRAQHRSLWFAPVPTLSGARDSRDGTPQLDDRHTYRIVCLARPTPPPPEHCPPRIGWSEPSDPFRLAAFADPAGTRNRRSTIVMPDFRALAAQAGQPPGPGGVEIVRPPGSQLTFSVTDDGRPIDAKPGEFGASTSSCTFALELLMIVAMFLFSLFLPVVVLLFQLWWLLLLRFCLPTPSVSLDLLQKHVDAGGTIAALPGPPPNRPDPPTAVDRMCLDEVLDTGGIADQLVNHGAGANPDVLAGIVDAAKNPPGPVVAPTVLEGPDDPLCEPPRRAVS